VEIAFLYQDLPEPIYMKVPRGLTNFVPDYNNEVACCLLMKSMYGLVHAARQ
jgi:hypothetical protein